MSIQDEIGMVKRMATNGGKGLLIAALGFIASLVFLAAAVVATVFVGGDPYRLLENENPQQVMEASVPQGGIVHVTGTKCVHGDQSVYVSGRSWWRQYSPENLVVPYLTGERASSPGCVTRIFANPVPTDLPLGIWRLEGLDVATEGSQQQNEPWFSESFEVTEGQRE